MTYQQKLSVTCEIESVWMNLSNPDMTLPQAVEKLEQLGHTVCAVDHENRRVRVAHSG